MGILFLLLIAGYMAWDWYKDEQEEQREKQRRAKIAGLRRLHLAATPDAPGSYERLGDAMREADNPQEAVACYEEAISLAAQQPGTAQGAGWIAGSGLEHKLRLAQLELAQLRDPARFGQTMQTRQQVCRLCGALGLPQDVDCRTCGGPLPVDTMLDTLKHVGIRSDIIRETVMFTVMLVVALIAIFSVAALPIEIRGVVMIAAVLVIPFRLLKKFGNPDRG